MLAVELAVVMLDRRLLRPEMLAGLGRDASRLRGGVRGPSRTQGVCSPGISASCSHCRPPAIHGRLSAHPLCARRAVARSGLGKDRGQQQQQRQQHAANRTSNASISSRATAIAAAAATGSGETGSGRNRAVRVRCLSRPRERWCPVRAQGGCPEPAMDGRRPEVGAGQRRFRLGIPPASAPGRRSPKTPTRTLPPDGRKTFLTSSQHRQPRRRPYARPAGLSSMPRAGAITRIASSSRLSVIHPATVSVPVSHTHSV